MLRPSDDYGRVIDMRQPLELAQKWEVTPDGEVLVSPDGAVLFGTRQQTPVVIKVLGQDFDSAGSAQALIGFDGHGAVKVLDAVPGALLLERVVPGTSLGDALRANPKFNDIEVFCHVALQLHRSKTPLESVPPVINWASALTRSAPDVLDQLGMETLTRTRTLFESLWQTETDKTVLHGDLHHDNILLDQTKGWVAIDPKGVVGEPAFEAAAFLRNPAEHSAQFTQPGPLEKRILAISTGTGWHQHRIVQWAYCQNVLSAVWSLRSDEDPAPALRLVNALEPLLPNV